MRPHEDEAPSADGVAGEGPSRRQRSPPVGRGSNLSTEDRRKGGERSSRQQRRTESGRFAGKAPGGARPPGR